MKNKKIERGLIDTKNKKTPKQKVKNRIEKELKKQDSEKEIDFFKHMWYIISP